jgi:hypothetical protein
MTSPPIIGSCSQPTGFWTRLKFGRFGYSLLQPKRRVTSASAVLRTSLENPAKAGPCVPYQTGLIKATPAAAAAAIVQDQP